MRIYNLGKNEYRWIRAISDPVIGDSGITHYNGLIVDITDLKRAEEAQRESEKLFREMADHIREVFWLFDWKAPKMGGNSSRGIAAMVREGY